jgi:uncharacterized protein
MRYVYNQVKADTLKKMVFVAGPRQVGKTTLSREWLNENHGTYYNWDIAEHRKKILKSEVSLEEKNIVFDEIHKFPKWKNYIKGFYDLRKPLCHKILVTGSAKLDVFRKGGDSLQGRYHLIRLHPFTLPELKFLKHSINIRDVLHFGGFPEPLFANSETTWRR